MSVANFQLDITSRVAEDNHAAEAPRGLVWQPTLTLWQPGATSAGDALFISTLDAPPHSDPPAAVAPQTPAAALPPAANRVQTRTGKPRRREHSLVAALAGFTLFQLVIAACLSRPPWEEWASFGYLVVGVFAALVALYLGGTWVLLRALWRATLRYSRQGGAALACGVVRGVALMVLIAGLHLAVIISSPRLVEVGNIAAGVIPAGNYRLKLVRGGTELAMEGAIGVGLSRKIAQVLDRHPRVQALHLNSHGGSAREARKLRDLIALRKLSTSTTQGCSGECTLAYVAGAQRRIGDQATLRFYRSDQPGMPEWALWRDYEQDRRDWLARGVSIGFIDQALTARGDAGWQPSLSELIGANIVSPSVEIVQPQAEQHQLDALTWLDRELRRAQFFTLLKEQEPEGYRKLVGEIHAGLPAPGSAEHLPLRIHPLAKALSYGRLAHAEDGLLLNYAEIILEQISLLYSDSAQLCNRYFGMDLSGAALDSAKYFSEDMLAKESALMAEVLRSSAVGEFRPPAKAAIAARWSMIIALIGKRYGATAALLFDPRPAKRDAGQTCHVLYEFYKAITALPTREAGPLLRYHFGQLQARNMRPTAPASTAKQVTHLSLPGATRRSSH